MQGGRSGSGTPMSCVGEAKPCWSQGHADAQHQASSADCRGLDAWSCWIASRSCKTQQLLQHLLLRVVVFMSAGIDVQGLFWALRIHELAGDGLDLRKAWALLEKVLGPAAFLMVGLFAVLMPLVKRYLPFPACWWGCWSPIRLSPHRVGSMGCCAASSPQCSRNSNLPSNGSGCWFPERYRWALCYMPHSCAFYVVVLLSS